MPLQFTFAKRVWLAVTIVVALAWALPPRCALQVPAVAAVEPKADVVRLVVDYGDGVEVHFTAIPWRDGMTALDALTAAQASKHGITVVVRGAGGGAMITQIGDLKNQGGRDTAKNWLYYVNDKGAEIGAGANLLKPGDTVLWKFEVYRYNS